MTLSPREAAFVAESDLRTVQRAVDGGVVRKRTRRVGHHTTRVLGRPELRYFGALRGNEDTLTPAGRLKLYEAVQHPKGGRATVGSFEVDVERVDRWIETRLAELDRVKGYVEEGRDGEPVLKGTGVPVHVVAALAEAGGMDEAAWAYPSLPREAVVAAFQYARVYPKKGRPYPAKSLKRMLSELALPDDVFGETDEDNAPRVVRL